MPIPETARPRDHPNAPIVTPEIAAEAAVWIARLHGLERSSAMERECLVWQATSEAHRLAFERCTDTWQDVARVSLGDYAAAAGRSPAVRAPPRRLRWAALAVAGIVGAGLAILQPWRDIDTYVTGVGEQQLVVLKDGTRLSLNTDTRARIELASTRRMVTIEKGEALFEVAKDARRPFVVRADGNEVLALGTVFSVRLTSGEESTGKALAVTLMEGQVSVRTTQGEDSEGSSASRTATPVLLQPGDRVRLSEATTANRAQRSSMQVDRPHIDQVIAWKRGEAVFDDVPLSEAVAEMNRYSRTPIVLKTDASVAGRRVSGLFRTGDNLGFAYAVAALHGLVVRDGNDHLDLAPG